MLSRRGKIWAETTKQAEIYFCTAVFFAYLQGKEVGVSLKQVELTFAVLRASKQSLHKLEFRVAFFKRICIVSREKK